MVLKNILRLLTRLNIPRIVSRKSAIWTIVCFSSWGLCLLACYLGCKSFILSQVRMRTNKAALSGDKRADHAMANTSFHSHSRPLAPRLWLLCRFKVRPRQRDISLNSAEIDEKNWLISFSSQDCVCQSLHLVVSRAPLSRVSLCSTALRCILCCRIVHSSDYYPHYYV